MKKINVITTDNPEKWDSILAEIGQFDFYHSCSYHRLAEINGEGTAILFVYRQSSYILVFPLLVREIILPISNQMQEHWSDATSVYGYPGPISTPGVPASLILDFQDHLIQYLTDNRIVSIFSRLNPLLPQLSLLAGSGEIVPIGTTVSIDLTLSVDKQRACYRKGHKYDIEKLKRSCFFVKKVSLDNIGAFIDIYTETMIRVNANRYYFFAPKYFNYLITDMKDMLHLFMCYKESEIACVGLFVLCNGIVHYHLAGTHNNYLKVAPMKLLLDTVRIWATEQGAHTFHLGGGIGSNRDSLFDFKRGFTDREHAYYVWRYIVNEPVYHELTESMCEYAHANPGGSFFPSYRDPLLMEEVIAKMQSSAGDNSLLPNKR